MSQSISPDRDGFHVREVEFTFLEETWKLDPQSKRAVTICNLFVNHHYSIADVVRVLDESRTDIIQALLKNGIIRDRRVRQMRPPEGIEHRKAVDIPI